MEIEDLKNLMKCMMIISYIDGFDSKEFELINKVFQEVWKESPEELEELIELMINEVAEYNSEGTMEQQFAEITQALSDSLAAEEKGKARNMMIKLLRTDGRITGEETEYYMKFKELLV